MHCSVSEDVCCRTHREETENREYGQNSSRESGGIRAEACEHEDEQRAIDQFTRAREVEWTDQFERRGGLDR